MRAIATTLNATTAANLAIAAAAKLTLVDHKDSFDRKELIAAMQTATGFYKKTFVGSNLSSALNKLQKDSRLTEQSTDRFALTQTEKKKLEGQLA